MKDFILRYKKLHIWLAVLLALLLFFYAGKNSRTLMNFVADNITQPLKSAMAALWSVFPFSVAEAVIYALIIFVVVFIVKFIVDLIRGAGAKIIYPRVMTLVCTALTLYTAFCLLWGVNYYTDSFKDMSGISGGAVTTEDLCAVTEYFAKNLADSADDVKRDENGLFAESRGDIIDASPTIYQGVADEFPYLMINDRKVKPFRLSRLMSMIDFTGFYFPLTGEANLNTDSPECLLPATVVHEMAHQRGISSEQECNFIAIVVSTNSGDAAYEYSGWLFGFIHLNNAIYEADRDRWEEIYSSLPVNVRRDIAYNNEYWDSMRGASTEAADKVYDTFLKGYGEESGIQSYGEVVDMLVDYYKDKC